MGIWLISYIALWVLVFLLLLAVFTLARQVGILHTRLGPVGARMVNAGLEIGETAPPLNATDLRGEAMTLGSERGLPTLLLFVTPSCSTCAALAPALRALWRSERFQLEIALVSLYSDNDQARQFVTKYKLKQIPVTTSPTVGFDYQVTSPPFALLVDEMGVVRAKGIINNSEHLESLLNVLDVGHESVQHWYEAQKIRDLRVATDLPVQ